MTANEMRTFVRTLALLVGDLVLNDDPVWEFYLLLRDIVDFMLCRALQVEAISILSKKISEHHRLYCALFNDTLKPKHHNMLHYCTIMTLSGVPSNYACDRFEANHQPSIRDAKATTSRRNIALTLAVKEQLRVAHRLLLGKGLSAVLETGPEAPHSFTDFAILPQDFNDTDISQPKYVNYKGTKYQENSCVILGTDCDGGPLFGIVMHILLILLMRYA
ncbi:hypothetical protein ONE63_007308 [Megalurothrips usitatus]|uniref:Uncharacterized protein n=1 Tax=Megalurothrips usitatus TaxID=439358 RepID=A0AAV7XUY8_9NEOP|nr:hypothetical protein ONE63_007308 [Megalurothrips usitatus]